MIKKIMNNFLLQSFNIKVGDEKEPR